MKSTIQNVIVDTTVMESNIRFPFDAQLLNRCRKQLVKEAEKCKIKLRQSYARVGTHLERKCSRYAHAKQYKRLNNHVKKLKTLLGRTIRDIQRHLEKDYQSNECLDDLLLMGIRLFNQEKTTKNKLYSLHEPAAYCISKGKRKAPFEFGFKAPFVVSHKMGLILAALSLEKNAHDGHTLRASIEQAERITGRKINKIFVDRGYRGHGIEDKKVYISGQRKGMTPTLIKELKRRSAIEPHIGHMKSDGKLKRNYLKGIIGSKINALLCAIGHNLRMICRHIINIFVKILASLFAQFVIQEQCAWH